MTFKDIIAFILVVLLSCGLVLPACMLLYRGAIGIVNRRALVGGKRLATFCLLYMPPCLLLGLVGGRLIGLFVVWLLH